MKEHGQLKHIVNFKIELGNSIKTKLNIQDYRQHIINLIGKDINDDIEYFEKVKKEVKIRYQQRVNLWGSTDGYKNSTLDNMFKSNDVNDLIVQLFELSEIVNAEK